MSYNHENNLEGTDMTGEFSRCNHGSGCVCNVVRKIAAAQNEVASNSRHCDISCERSIKDLLSPTELLGVNRHTTIPFILYCKKSCKPFFGNGVYQTRVGGNTHFHCLTSPFFRVNKIKRDCCAQIELLLPVNRSGTVINPCLPHSVCSYFPTGGNPNGHVHNFRETGICITVDLKEFKAISCLDAITPIPAPMTGQGRHNMLFGDAVEKENK